MDSNQRPTDYESAALTAELLRNWSEYKGSNLRPQASKARALPD